MVRRIAVIVGVVLAAATPASAGGAVWDFDRPLYAAGDEATAFTSVWWDDANDLGTPDDGPYQAYILRTPPADALVTGEWPSIPPEAMWVGEVEIGLGPIEQDGFMTGPNHAIVRFTVPDVPPGAYDLLHCNDPCTTTLGDITWGRFVVGGPSVAQEPAGVPGLPEVLEGVDGDAHEPDGEGDGRVVAGVDDAVEVPVTEALEQPVGPSGDGVEVAERGVGADRTDSSDVVWAVAVAGVVRVRRQAERRRPVG